jgi:hypothetical protein
MVIWAAPALVMWFTPYRVGRPGMRAIGQLAAEPDYFLKKRALGGYANIKPIFFDRELAPADPRFGDRDARRPRREGAPDGRGRGEAERRSGGS